MTRCATNLEECVNHKDFPELDDEQLMKHVLTIGSQTRGRSTGCVEGPRVDRSLLDDQMNHVSSVKRVY